MNKKAFITGVTGQDGSYLVDLLSSKGYEVHGLIRQSTQFTPDRWGYLRNAMISKKLEVHHGDLMDASGMRTMLETIQPDEVYNLAAQSHVGISFEQPVNTTTVTALGALNLLDAIKRSKLNCKFYQASSSEMFGKVRETPQNETTPFYPRSPYGCAKAYAHYITQNYRESYGMFASNGILFNHESPRRGETFVTRKITRGISRIACGLEQKLILGNLDSKRDWGHARDYVLAQWLILQHHCPDDFVISTGIQSSVREFVKWACRRIGIEVQFEGRAIDEKGIVTKVNNKDVKLREGSVIIEVSEKYFRPSEVNSLCGDPQKAKKDLNWSPTLTAEQLCWEMIDSDMIIAKSECNHKHQI